MLTPPLPFRRCSIRGRPGGRDYAIPIKGNPGPHEQIAGLMKRRPGRRPPNHVVRQYASFHYSFHYRARSRSKARRGGRYARSTYGAVPTQLERTGKKLLRHLTTSLRTWRATATIASLGQIDQKCSRHGRAVRMRIPRAKDAKYGFGRLIDLARAEPVTVARHGRPVVVVMSVGEFERLKGIETGHVDSHSGTQGTAE